LQPLKVEILCKISVTKACNHYCVVIVMKKYTLKWKATRRFLKHSNTANIVFHYPK